MQVTGKGSITFFNWEKSHVPEILEEAYLSSAYTQFLSGKRDLTIFEVGANIGLWSMFGAQYAKTLYAFEPAGQNAEIFKENIKNNGIKNVVLVEKAVAVEDGKLTFYDNDVNTTMRSLLPTVSTGGKTEVDAIRLDTFVKENKIKKIDFMNLDIEGYEENLFSSESFANIAPILDSFVYEYHDWTKSNYMIINHRLQQLGYKVWMINQRPTVFGAIKIWEQ